MEMNSLKRGIQVELKVKISMVTELKIFYLTYYMESFQAAICYYYSFIKTFGIVSLILNYSLFLNAQRFKRHNLPNNNIQVIS